MIGKAIKWLLIGFGESDNPQYEIRELIGDRIYPNVIPQKTGLPAVVYNYESDPFRVKITRAIAEDMKLELDVFGKTYQDVNQLSTLIISHLHRYKNHYNSVDSDGVGFGNNPGSSYVDKWGSYSPPTTGDVNYIGGIQILQIMFDSSIESFDNKLQSYRNTLAFTFRYVLNPIIWGMDVGFNFNDLNLMATRNGSDPKYHQPVSLNDGVDFLYSPSVHTDESNNTISSTNLNGIYDNYEDTSSDSSLRPIIKQSAIDPPYYNGSNYLQFSDGDFLKSQHSDKILRKYKEITFFTIFDLPDSYATNHSGAIVGKDSNGASNSGGIIPYTVVTSQGTAFELTKFGIDVLAINSAGEERGIQVLSGLLSWPMFGMWADMTWNKPVFAAVSMKVDPDDNTRLKGEIDYIVSTALSSYGDNNDYGQWSDAVNSPLTWNEYPFQFETLHSDISNNTPGGGGSSVSDLSGAINLFELQIWPKALTFGSSLYLQIKRDMITKYGWWNRTTQ